MRHRIPTCFCAQKEGNFFGVRRHCARSAQGAARSPQGAAQRRKLRRAAAPCGAQRRRRRRSLVASHKSHFQEWPFPNFSLYCLLWQQITCPRTPNPLQLCAFRPVALVLMRGPSPVLKSFVLHAISRSKSTTSRHRSAPLRGAATRDAASLPDRDAPRSRLLDNHTTRNRSAAPPKAASLGASRKHDFQEWLFARFHVQR